MANRLGGTLARPIVQAVQLAGVGVSEQLASQRRQQAVEGLPARQVQIQLVRLPQAPLVKSLPKHSSALLANSDAPEYNPWSNQPGFPARFLADRLADALVTYTQAGGTGEPIKRVQDEAVPAMQAAIEKLCAFFHGCYY